MSEKKYVEYGNCCGGSCGASGDITGCRFSLAPMTDDYVSIILDAVSKVDTSKVYDQMGKLSTLYRGKQNHVVDAVKACFVNAYRTGVHMVMEATFSKGCPGDTDAEAFLAEDDVLQNEELSRLIHFPAACKISLYPMGVSNYMEYIASVVNHAVDIGIYAGSSHYVTILEGDVHDLFDYFSYVNQYCGENLSHYVLEATLSVNSPTRE